MPDDVVGVLDTAYRSVVRALHDLPDWTTRGSRPDQYACDIAADEAAFAVLDDAGFGIVSEERSVHEVDREIVVVVDPVDGTANAVRGIPYYATSLCAVDGAGILAALVVNLATGTRFEAVRGRGATRDGQPLHVDTEKPLEEATVVLCGMPRGTTEPWRHMRAFGATALEMCDVAQGLVDAYVNTSGRTRPWDYLGALLICQEAGAATVDGRGEELVTLDSGARRSPQVAATPALLDEIVAYAWP